MGLCVSAGAATLVVAWSTFTLSWTHSVEKTEWQEEWQVSADSLEVTRARIKGAGAGMEPPADARLEDGWWVYRPSLPPLPNLILARSDVGEEWRLCHGDDCLDLYRLAPVDQPVILRPCPQ
ncbi:MAG: DUF1850 domain-containing protein [Rhodospirillales bacterium]